MATAEPGGSPPGPGERLEASPAGRALISAVLVVTCAAIGVTNLPSSEIKDRLVGHAQPYLVATGLDQDWGMFAPDPRVETVVVSARVDDADGTSSVWRTPARPGLGAYVDYRWQKLGEHVHQDDQAWMWPAFARRLADRSRAAGRHPIRVTLLRGWCPLAPPGAGPECGPWREYAFHTLRLPDPAVAMPGPAR